MRNASRMPKAKTIKAMIPHSSESLARPTSTVAEAKISVATTTPAAMTYGRQENPAPQLCSSGLPHWPQNASRLSTGLIWPEGHRRPSSPAAQ